MGDKNRRLLTALLKQARLDGRSAFVGIVNKQDGRTIAVLLAEQPFVFKALRRNTQAALIEYLYLEHFTRFDEVQIIDKFKDPVLTMCVTILDCKLPVIVTETPC